MTGKNIIFLGLGYALGLLTALGAATLSSILGDWQ